MGNDHRKQAQLVGRKCRCEYLVSLRTKPVSWKSSHNGRVPRMIKVIGILVLTLSSNKLTEFPFPCMFLFFVLSPFVFGSAAAFHKDRINAQTERYITIISNCLCR